LGESGVGKTSFANNVFLLDQCYPLGIVSFREITDQQFRIGEGIRVHIGKSVRLGLVDLPLDSVDEHTLKRIIHGVATEESLEAIRKGTAKTDVSNRVDLVVLFVDSNKLVEVLPMGYFQSFFYGPPLALSKSIVTEISRLAIQSKVYTQKDPLVVITHTDQCKMTEAELKTKLSKSTSPDVPLWESSYFVSKVSKGSKGSNGNRANEIERFLGTILS